MKATFDKTLWGLGLWWTRPDIVCGHHLVTLHVGPIVVSIWDEHESNKRKAPLAAQEMSFRQGSVSE